MMQLLVHKTRNGLNKKNRSGAKGWKSIDLYRICSLEGLKSGVTIISYVVSTLYQLLYQRCFLLDPIHHLSPSDHCYLSSYIFEASAVNHPPPPLFFIWEKGGMIFLKQIKLQKIPICEFEIRNVYLSDSKHIYDIKLFVIFGLCSFSEIHGGEEYDIAKQKNSIYIVGHMAQNTGIQFALNIIFYINQSLNFGMYENYYCICQK